MEPTAEETSCRCSESPTAGGFIKAVRHRKLRLRKPTTSSSVNNGHGAGKQIKIGVGEVYQIGPRLARGAFLCYDKDTKQRFVCKTFDCNHIKEFQNEVDIMQLLKDEPGIVRAIAAFADSDCCYLIMEFCERGDLFSLMRAKPRFLNAEREAASIFRQLMQAVDRCHKKGVIHRDIKLGNIFVCSTTPVVIKLGDFGISTKFEIGNAVFYDRVGTARYRAPELVGCNGYSESIDVWNCGIVLYKMLSGEFPFNGGEYERGTLKYIQRLEREILYKRVSISKRIWSQISLSAKDLMLGMLEKNPRRRLTVTQVLDHPWLLNGI